MKRVIYGPYTTVIFSVTIVYVIVNGSTRLVYGDHNDGPGMTIVNSDLFNRSQYYCLRAAILTTRSDLMMMRDDQKAAAMKIELTTINSEQEEEEQSSTEKFLTINDEQKHVLLEVNEQQEQLRSQ